MTECGLKGKGVNGQTGLLRDCLSGNIRVGRPCGHGAGRRVQGDPAHEKAPVRRPEAEVGPSESFGRNRREEKMKCLDVAIRPQSPHAFCDDTPVNCRDPFGFDIWIEGPSGAEPTGHQSINVGDPNGAYRSYSYGVDGKIGRAHV